MIIVLYIGSTVNALVGNICTSEMMDKLDNITTTEVMIKVNKNEWESGSKISVKIDVGEEKSIRNIIIWAETVDGEQPGTHMGYWTPISEHVYVDGCNGPANATISNQIDLNISEITYEWNSPNVQNSEPPKTPTTSTPTSSQPSTSSAVPSSSPVQSTSTSTSPSPTTSPTPTECHDKHDKHDLIYDKNTLTTIIKLIYPRQEEKMSTISMKNQMNYLTYTKASVGSIVFKGVIQLMNHPDDEIYSFESDVIKDNSNHKHMLDDTKDDNVPSSVANSKFILNSLVLPSILTLIIGFLTY